MPYASWLESFSVASGLLSRAARWCSRFEGEWIEVIDGQHEGDKSKRGDVGAKPEGSGGGSGETRNDDLRICLICAHRLSRRIISQVLLRELGAEADLYASCEDALCSDLDHDVYVVYDYFGRQHMNGPQGTRRLRVVRPDAYVLGVTANPGCDKQFIQAGADTAIVAGERATKQIVHVVRERVVTTLYPAEARSLKEGEARRGQR